MKDAELSVNMNVVIKVRARLLVRFSKALRGLVGVALTSPRRWCFPQGGRGGSCARLCGGYVVPGCVEGT